MSTYEVLLTIHLLALAVWLGGGLALNVIATRTPPQDRPAVVPQVAFYGNTVLTPAALVLVLSGLGLVAELDLNLGDTWIWLGIAIWVASLGIGAGLIGPTSNRLGEIAAGPDPDVARMTALRSRILWLSRLTLVLIVLAVIDMVAKPGL